MADVEKSCFPSEVGLLDRCNMDGQLMSPKSTRATLPWIENYHKVPLHMGFAFKSRRIYRKSFGFFRVFPLKEDLILLATPPSLISPAKINEFVCKKTSVNFHAVPSICSIHAGSIHMFHADWWCLFQRIFQAPKIGCCRVLSAVSRDRDFCGVAVEPVPRCRVWDWSVARWV